MPWTPCVTLLRVMWPLWSGLRLSVESYSRLLWFCFTSLCDWIASLAPLSQPMRKPNDRDLIAPVFPRLALLTCICHEGLCIANNRINNTTNAGIPLVIQRFSLKQSLCLHQGLIREILEYMAPDLNSGGPGFKSHSDR